VHAETRACIHLHDPAADLIDRLRDVGRDEIDACDIEADDPCRAAGDLAVRVMDLRGAIDRGAAGRDVRSGAQVKDLPAGSTVFTV
jgi:hypothetical protein